MADYITGLKSRVQMLNSAIRRSAAPSSELQATRDKFQAKLYRLSRMAWKKTKSL